MAISLVGNRTPWRPPQSHLAPSQAVYETSLRVKSISWATVVADQAACGMVRFGRANPAEIQNSLQWCTSDLEAALSTQDPGLQPLRRHYAAQIEATQVQTTQ